MTGTMYFSGLRAGLADTLRFNLDLFLALA